MNRNKTRLTLDIFLSVALVLLMFYQFTGNLVHEVAGAAFFTAIVAHLCLSARWMKIAARSARQRKLKKAMKINMIMGILLLASTVIMALTSLCISNQLAKAGVGYFFLSDMTAYSIAAGLHAAVSYAMCVLALMHLALHWKFFAGFCHVPYNPGRRKAIGVAVKGAAALGCVAIATTGIDVIGQRIAFALETEDCNDQSNEGSSETEETQTPQTPEAQNKSTDKRDDSKKNKDERSTPNEAPAESEQTQDASDASSLAEQICPLCKKACPLSNPLCDRPYLAGLL